jgi:5-methylcytosine-specific restriction endonuclease McrA
LRSLKARERHLTGTMTKHQIDRSLRYSKASIEWRKSVFERDNHTCQECGKRGGYLEAHHVKPFAFFPELRYELSNGQTMCRPCHNKTKTDYRSMRRIYGNQSR